MKEKYQIRLAQVVMLSATICYGQAPMNSTNAIESDPDPGKGVGYHWTVQVDGDDEAFVTGHVGAWSWEDDSLFDAETGEDPVGWTHTSNWLLLRLNEPTYVTILHQRQEGVPWPSAEDLTRTASVANMNPSFTLYEGYDGDDGDHHTYNNRGEIAWAEDLTYLDHLENNSKSFVQQTWYLEAGDYTVALGSNADSNDTDRQGYKTVITTSTIEPAMHSVNASASDPDPEAGVPYQWTVELDADDEATVSGHVGAWSWEDDSLFDAETGEDPVGWTHTSNWLLLRLNEPTYVTILHQRQAGVPWPSAEDPSRTASIANMNPSFSLYAGYDGDGADNHTYNNRGEIVWAEDLTYLDHLENNSKSFVQQTWYLEAGDYTVALGSNADANDTDRQGYKTVITTSTIEPAMHSVNASALDPDPGAGVPYQWTVELDADDEAMVSGHVGAWSWEDDSLFDAETGGRSSGLDPYLELAAAASQ